MIKSEICKLVKIKAIIVAFLLLIGVTVYSMFTFGAFGHNSSIFLFITFSEKDGELLTGQKGYEQNKDIATRYAGAVNDLLLEQLHLDFINSSYFSFEDGDRLYNATFRFFQNVFNIDSENHAKVSDVWGKVDSTVQYGFSGDWDAYRSIINIFFMSFSVFIIILAAPLFTYDKECGMVELLGTVKNGGRWSFKHKVRTAFCTINILLFILLTIISAIHFSRYGFANADMSIQCSFEQRFTNVEISLTLSQFAFWQILFGIIGCNTILLLIILISMLSQTTLTAFAISLASTWFFSYSAIKLIANDYLSNLLLFTMPVNALNTAALVREVSAGYALWGIFTVRIILFAILLFAINLIWQKKYILLSRRGD